jgi:hypothetical protein
MASPQITTEAEQRQHMMREELEKVTWRWVEVEEPFRKAESEDASTYS